MIMQSLGRCKRFLATALRYSTYYHNVYFCKQYCPSLCRIRAMQCDTLSFSSVHTTYERQPSLPFKLCAVQQNRISTLPNNLYIENKVLDTKSGIKKVLQHLDLDVNRGNRIYSIELEVTLQDLTENGPCDHFDGLDPGIVLLKCCGDLMADVVPSDRLQLARKVWSTLQQLGVSLTVDHYNTLLACYAANKHPVSPSEFLASMGKVEPNEETFHCLLKCTCEVGNLEQATEVISCMKNRSFPVSEPVFNTLIFGHAFSGDANRAREVLETMRTALLVPTAETYTEFLRGLANVGDINNIRKIYQEAISANCIISSNQLITILKSLATSGNSDLIPAVLPWLPELSADRSNPMRHLLVQLVHLSLDRPVTLLLPTLPLDETSPHGKFLVRETVKANWSAASIVAFCSALSEHNSLALTQATEAALQLRNIDLSLQLLAAVKQQGFPLRPHYFWPLFLEEALTYGEEGVFAILHHMKELGIAVNDNTLASYVLPAVSLALPGVLVRKLQDHGLSLGAVFGPVVYALLKHGHVDDALKLCESYNTPMNCVQLVWPLVQAYSKGATLDSTIRFIKLMVVRSVEKDDWPGRFMLEVLTNKKLKAKPHHIEEIIKAFSEAGLQCSTFAADIISQNVSKLPASIESKAKLESLSKMSDSDVFVSPTELFSHHMPHPRDMTLEELEGHLVELTSKNLNTRGVLRRLLQLYCRIGNVEKAMTTKQEFEATGQKLTAGMTAALFDLFVRTGQLGEAESCINELSESTDDFALDEHKVVDFAALLVASGKNKEAFNLIKNHASKNKIRGGPALSQNCRRLLNALAEKGMPLETKEMFDIMVKCGYCSVSNKLLGPLVRAYINCDDLEGAVIEYKNCCSTHKNTPLQHELLCRLVEATDLPTNPDTALLQQVIDATSKVHGAASTHIALVVALAETGKTKQLQRLLRSPNKKLRSVLLMNRCSRLVDENKLEALQNLVDASRGLTVIDTSPLYTFMLQIHSRRGDCSGALLLWTKMQDQDCQPSSEFLVALAELLKSHKREVPFVIPSNELKLKQISTNQFVT